MTPEEETLLRSEVIRLSNAWRGCMEDNNQLHRQLLLIKNPQYSKAAQQALKAAHAEGYAECREAAIRLKEIHELPSALSDPILDAIEHLKP